MANRKKAASRTKRIEGAPTVASDPDELLKAALERGGDSLETGRYLISYREGAAEEGMKSLKTQGFRVADARDFEDQAVTSEGLGDAEALMYPEIGVALVAGPAMEHRGMSIQGGLPAEGAAQAIEPEYFVFAENGDYLRGFATAASTIARNFDSGNGEVAEEEEEGVDAEVLGATWGLINCRVPASMRSGLGIKVAILDTGMDLGHPDFAGRAILGRTFVTQPVQDMNGHGTHCIGTACGPMAPAGAIARYGIGHRAGIFAGKVLSNAGSGSTGSVLAGMNWAIANRCEVISMSLGSQSPVQFAYTAAGAAALAKGCLIVAAAGNAASTTGAPANSPTIMSVASLDSNLRPSSFSNHGKVEIAAPGRDVFSSWLRPLRYRTISGTSMATPHVAGCAALWAQSNASLRGINLWRRLQASARRLPFPASRVGSGLVQAP